MPQLRKDNARDIGLAEDRYSKPEDIVFRGQVADRIRRIADFNRSQMQLVGWQERDKKRQKLLRQADRFEICGLQYADLRCMDCTRPYIGPRRCESRICPACCRKYAARIRHRQTELFKQLQPTKRHRLMFLTLTQRSHPLYPPSSSDARRLFRSTRRLVKKLWPKKSGCGAFGVLEQGEKHHLHIHLLVYGQFVPQPAISNLWLEITGDSRVVDIREVRQPRKGLNYLLKYVGKPKQTDDPGVLARYLDMLIGVRRIHTYGLFYNFPLVKRERCPCPFCSGKLRLRGFDAGPYVPLDALFFQEAVELAKIKMN